MGRVLLAALIGLIALVPADAAQDGGHDPDPSKCKKCKGALDKAMGYLKSTYKSGAVQGHTRAKIVANVFSGFAFMMDDTGRYRSDLAECVEWCRKAILKKEVDRGWYLAMCAFFLCEYALKHGMTPQIRGTLQQALPLIEKEQEETGGWCHYKGMAEERNYHNTGGSRDIGMITAMMYGTFQVMKKFDLEPGPMEERALKNLESISDGAGFTYGTGNRAPDPAMGRASYTLLGLIATRQTSHPLYSKLVSGLQKRYKRCQRGHAYGPIHYFSAAAAMHRLGPAEYRKFTDHYLDDLIGAQSGDGSVEMKHDGGQNADWAKDKKVGATAVFACIIQMQREGAFVPEEKKSAKKKGSKKKRGRSPFSRRKKKK